MVPDRQKVRTDGRNGRTDGRTHGRRQNYIPPTSSGDNKGSKTNGSLMKVESIAECSLGAICNTFGLH